MKFNITADSYTADRAECPEFGEVCCPGRFVDSNSKEKPQGDGVGFDPKTFNLHKGYLVHFDTIHNGILPTWDLI